MVLVLLDGIGFFMVDKNCTCVFSVQSGFGDGCAMYDNCEKFMQTDGTCDA